MSTTTGNVSTPVGSSHLLQATRDERGVVVPEEHKLSAPAENLERIGGNIVSIHYAMGHWTSAGQGSHVTTDPIPSALRDSQIAVSITELDPSGNPFIALAGMAVYNVVPLVGKVTVHWWVGWDSPLHIRLNYIIVN
ncbi:hypothetical protein ACWIID_02190 [Streptomyces phaeochromogenes]